METQNYATRLEAAEAIFLYHATRPYDGDSKAVGLVDMVVREAYYDSEYKKEYKGVGVGGVMEFEWDYQIQVVQAYKAMEILTKLPEKDWLGSQIGLLETRAALWAHVVKGMVEQRPQLFLEFGNFMISSPLWDGEEVVIQKCIKNILGRRSLNPGFQTLLETCAHKGNETILRTLLQVVVHQATRRELEELLA